MALYLNQGHRELHPVRVGESYRAIDIHLPDGYKRTSQDTKAIGSGSYGTVIRTVGITNRVDGRGRKLEIEVAVKKFFRPMHSPPYAQRCYRELKLLQHLDHPNIARIIDMFAPSRHPNELNDIFLVTEYVGSTLDKLLEDQIKLYPTRDRHVYLHMQIIPNVIRDTLSALLYLKAANVLHRDLKPHNLAINSNGKTVLIDYGLARIRDQSSPLTAEAYTPHYAAPEVFFWQPGSYGREADIWSVGCILYQLLTWELLFDKVPSKQMFILYISLFGPISETFLNQVPDANTKASIAQQNERRAAVDLREYFDGKNKVANFDDPNHATALDFLSKCLHFDPTLRITIEQALVHPFVRGNVPDYRHVQPLVYNDDGSRGMDDWRRIVFEEIRNFRARADTPMP